jgi:hypothetical protein
MYNGYGYGSGYDSGYGSSGYGYGSGYGSSSYGYDDPYGRSSSSSSSSSYYNDPYGRSQTTKDARISYMVDNQPYTVNIFLRINEKTDPSAPNAAAVAAAATILRTNKYDPLPFHPNMTTTENLYPTGIIMFVPLYSLTKKDLKSVLTGQQKDEKTVFTTPATFQELLENVSKNDKNQRLGVTQADFTSATPTKQLLDVLKNNLDLVAETFFPVDEGHLYILGRDYVVTACTYDVNKDVIRNPTLDGRLLPDSYDVTFNLTLVLASEYKNNKNSRNFFVKGNKGQSSTSGTQCEQNGLELDNMMQQLLGTNLGLQKMQSEVTRRQAWDAATLARESLNKQTITHPDWQRFLANPQRDWAKRKTKTGRLTRDEEDFTRYVDRLLSLDRQLAASGIDEEWLAASLSTANGVFTEKTDTTAADEAYYKRKLEGADNNNLLLQSNLKSRVKRWKDLLRQKAETEIKLKERAKALKFKDLKEKLNEYYQTLLKIQQSITLLERKTADPSSNSSYHQYFYPSSQQLSANDLYQAKKDLLYEQKREERVFTDILTWEKKMDDSTGFEGRVLDNCRRKGISTSRLNDFLSSSRSSISSTSSERLRSTSSSSSSSSNSRSRKSNSGRGSSSSSSSTFYGYRGGFRKHTLGRRAKKGRSTIRRRRPPVKR